MALSYNFLVFIDFLFWERLYYSNKLKNFLIDDFVRYLIKYYEIK